MSYEPTNWHLKICHDKSRWDKKKNSGQPPPPSHWLSQTATPLKIAVIGQIWALRHQGGKEAVFWLDEPSDRCWIRKANMSRCWAPSGMCCLRWARSPRLHSGVSGKLVLKLFDGRRPENKRRKRRCVRVCYWKRCGQARLRLFSGTEAVRFSALAKSCRLTQFPKIRAQHLSGGALAPSPPWALLPT